MNITNKFEREVLQKIMPKAIFKTCKDQSMETSIYLLKQEIDGLKSSELEMQNMSNIKIYQLILLKYAQQLDLYGMILYECKVEKYYENHLQVKNKF